MQQPIIIIGGGPAGLMSAYALGKYFQRTPEKRHPIYIMDSQKSLGRKFLQAGKGGLNLTHQTGLNPQSYEKFLQAFGSREFFFKEIFKHWGPSNLLQWVEELGHATFTGTSGKVFPEEKKAGPLLHSWLKELTQMGIVFKPQHTMINWNNDWVEFKTPSGITEKTAYSFLVFAMGGASWPHLGSTGKWVPLFREKQITVTPLRPANCGFSVLSPQNGWTSVFKEKLTSGIIKNVKLSFFTQSNSTFTSQGDLIITPEGIKGHPIYQLSSELRNHLDNQLKTSLDLDLFPEWDIQKLFLKLKDRNKKKSFSSFLQSQLKCTKEKLALIYELCPPSDWKELLCTPLKAAEKLKSLPLYLAAPFPIEEAISTAGGVSFSQLKDTLELKNHPHQYVCGEMLDWEAPTGGFLLTGVMSSGQWVSSSIINEIENS